MSNYAGSEWVRAAMQRRGRTLSPLGAKVADLLGDLYQGIYHIQREALHERVRWEDEHHIEIVVSDQFLATFDFDGLTRLVVLCHDRCLRCELHGRGRHYVRLMSATRPSSRRWSTSGGPRAGRRPCRHERHPVPHREAADPGGPAGARAGPVLHP
jgi:hypothetical protein